MKLWCAAAPPPPSPRATASTPRHGAKATRLRQLLQRAAVDAARHVVAHRRTDALRREHAAAAGGVGLEDRLLQVEARRALAGRRHARRLAKEGVDRHRRRAHERLRSVASLDAVGAVAGRRVEPVGEAPRRRDGRLEHRARHARQLAPQEGGVAPRVLGCRPQPRAPQNAAHARPHELESTWRQRRARSPRLAAVDGRQAAVAIGGGLVERRVRRGIIRLRELRWCCLRSHPGHRRTFEQQQAALAACERRRQALEDLSESLERDMALHDSGATSRRAAAAFRVGCSRVAARAARTAATREHRPYRR